VLTIWICVAATAVVSCAIKATGPTLLGDRPLPSRAAGVIGVLAPTLLAALIISDVLGPGWSSADGALALGVATAAGARSARAPTPLCVAAAIAITAVTRAIA
jgi:branched-subunit amino acid transport protein